MTRSFTNAMVIKNVFERSFNVWLDDDEYSPSFCDQYNERALNFAA